MKIISTILHPKSFETQTLSSLADLKWKCDGKTILWLDISEYADINDFKDLQKTFRLHLLALEDCVNIRQRPKIDDFNENLFLICRTISQCQRQFAEGQQIGIFKGKDYLITIHKESVNLLNRVFEEISKDPSLFERSSSFILYRILDEVIDNFEDAVKNIEESECILGTEVLKDPPPKNVLDQIYTNRGNLLLIGRFLRPQSHVIHHLAKGDYQLVNIKTAPYFRDIHDHTLRTLERIDSLTEMNLGSLSIYSSSVNNSMNQVIKLLTVISTIGVPLTVLTGWFGMNIEMVGTEWPLGFEIVLLLLISLIAVTILIFRRKNWL